jgi:threonine/homoserine/homoserine lactone efflux protein
MSLSIGRWYHSAGQVDLGAARKLDLAAPRTGPYRGAMPALTTLLLFAATTVALVAIPGPNSLYIAARSASQGRRAGVASALGVEAGTVVHVTAAAVGVSALIASSATAFSTVKWLGVAYLVHLGIRTLRSGGAPADGGQPLAAAPLRRAFAEGAVVNVLNPKVALFFLAFLPQFIDPSHGSTASQTLVLGLVFFAIALCMDLLFVVAASAIVDRLRDRAGYARRERHVTGAIYLVLGGAAAAAGGRH